MDVLNSRDSGKLGLHSGHLVLHSLKLLDKKLMCGIGLGSGIGNLLQDFIGRIIFSKGHAESLLHTIDYFMNKIGTIVKIGVVERRSCRFT